MKHLRICSCCLPCFSQRPTFWDMHLNKATVKMDASWYSEMAFAARHFFTIFRLLDRLLKEPDFFMMHSLVLVKTAYRLVPNHCLHLRLPCGNSLEHPIRSSGALSRRLLQLTCLPATFSKSGSSKLRQLEENSSQCIDVVRLWIFAGTLS